MLWTNIQVLMKDSNVFKNAHPIERLEAFSEYIKEVDHIEKDKLKL